MELLDSNASPFKIYKQSKKILKNTSRAKNPNWYLRSTEIQLQWHILVGTQSVVSAIYNAESRQWWKGPDLPQVTFALNDAGEPEGLDDGSRNALHEIVRQILASKEFGFKPKALGITLHLADGMRTRDLDPEFGGDTDFEGLNELLIAAPDIALGDDSIDPKEGKWRLLPLLGTVEGDRQSIAIQVSSQYECIINEFRDYGELRNIPIVAETRSAALEAFASAPLLLPESQDLANTLMLLQFDSFTLLGATGKRGEISSVRPLMHRSGGTLSPGEISDFITNTAALLNLKAPNVVLISLTGVPQGELNDLLAQYLESHSDANSLCINAGDSPIVEGVPENRFEIAASVSEAGNSSSSVTQLREKWAIQDFYGASAEQLKQMPDRADLRLLKFAGIAQKAALVALCGFIGWTATDFFSKMRTDAWKIGDGDAQEMEVRLTQLQKEQKEWNYWNMLLTKRSEGWLAMEALLKLFPSDGGIILKTSNFNAAANSSKSDKDKIGIKREWRISGYANPEVAKYLPSLGSKARAADILNQIAEENQADYLYVGEDTRDLDVRLQQRQGAMPPSAQYPAKVARHFRTTFDLTLTQSFSASDDLAMSTKPLSTD